MANAVTAVVFFVVVCVKISRGADVCNECELRGDITIGGNTKIHPGAAIIAEAGPIIIGANNVIEERAVIFNRLPPGGRHPYQQVLIIGANNVFQADSHSEALKIGNNNVLKSHCFLGREVELSNNCVVGESSRLTCCNRARERTPNMSGAMLCNECELHFRITIGPNTVIHPGAAIIAEAGPIMIGANNVIEERAVIINRLPPGGTPSYPRVLMVGNNNVFQAGSHSEALKIGNNNVLKANSFVGREVELSNNCVVGAGCRYTCPGVVANNAVVCSPCN